MLSLNEIKVGIIVQIADEPYLIIKVDHHKMGRGGAIVKVKIKNLISGNVLDKTFQGNDKVEKATTQMKRSNFMYKDDINVYFMDNDNYEQFSMEIEQIGNKVNFLKDGTDVDVLYYDDKPVAIHLPIKIELEVISAPPGVKGNSVGNVTKQVELETGVKINVPMFINVGDIIRVNTETGEYAERVS